MQFSRKRIDGSDKMSSSKGNSSSSKKRKDIKDAMMRSWKNSVVPLPDESGSSMERNRKSYSSSELSWVGKIPPRVATQKRIEIQTEIERVRKRVDEIYRNVDLRFIPTTSALRRWNGLILIALLLTATWTPFEVAFVSLQYDARFVVNRAVDFLFIVDFGLQFFVCYEDPLSGAWVRDQRAIVWRYARTRMVFDALAGFGSLALDLAAISSEDELESSKLLETGRLLRFCKLLRFSELMSGTLDYLNLFRGDQWTYNRLSLFKFLVIILSLVHWMACVWRLVPMFEQSGEKFEETWIVKEDLLHAGAMEQYVVCIYWASTTITTIGYGDIANPGTEMERFVAVLTMLLGALVWARIIGGITSIVSAFNLQDLEFSEQMDRLNAYMESKRMPPDLRHRLRSYFRARRQMEQDSTYAILLEKMSPTLRGEVARTVSKEWLARVPWLNEGSLGFIASVAIALEHELYAPQEIITGPQLRVLTRGVVARNSRIFTRGSVWGIDMIVHSDVLRDKKPSRALTFAQVLCLQQNTLEELLEVFPQEHARIRASALWIALRKSFIRYATRLRIGRKVMHQIASDAARVGLDVAQIFKKHDMRGRDELSRREFLAALRELGYCGPLSLMEVMLTRFDINGDGAVDYREFINYFMRGYANERMSAITDDYRKRTEHRPYVDRKRILALRQQQIAELGPPLGDDAQPIPNLSVNSPKRVETRNGLHLGSPHLANQGTERWFEEDEDEAANVVVVQRKDYARSRAPERQSDAADALHTSPDTRDNVDW
ncbi:Potassium voltage-gated channel subfamily H member 1 [Hondaea fermentalgiana]|uniref:Potassium voltage-gated channel subfamily H member 1 n=1 Tax=Hondaea fermentalgiana TaxID=2315210 RepID=A0A2R5G0Q2_9STRA|nr:Potassium voltage-gated channel subfamily H member 1 [Hondaea fermentalgiana]|eukprot:GBG24580.1 Potassium voltage-gated channel subfamily H member 1 [Hondaea fermentalgiana]